jgi:integrative and conjugative element protein (TIGR02256 family)
MPRSQIISVRQFALPNSTQRLVLMPEALQSFLNYRQKGAEPEAGGLLFAEFDFPLIRIAEVSTPHITDHRWTTLFVPNRILQRRLIKNVFKRGLHFVGEWHTHPEPYPKPSSLDLNSASDAFIKSKHELNYFVMVIVGNETKALNLWVSIHNGMSHDRLRELSIDY